MTADLAEDLSSTIAALHRRGWCDGTGGNFSCVLQREPLQLLMAPSGVDKGTVAPEALIVVDGDGQVLRGHGRASAETLLHLEIVRRSGAGAVLHTHSQAATLLSRRALATDRHSPGASGADGSVVLEQLEMLKGLKGIHSHDTRVRLPVLANDQDLRRLSVRAAPLLADAPQGLLIAGHGLYAWGDALFSARRHLEILEFLLEQHWRQLLLDGLNRLPNPSH
ncbi:methylthioribulose 1-phosphate dehydratase [Cyanobium sp. ATX 6F1]|uniref:methylthioribulose 1-phosphate dehydratase n=1 Tax=unclassified Cyanobium TaxID=2627006 RepID=UPI0020CCE706|nr:methylthioribulose 1-phosphate dehydratase [Cyanobium sp. ATX 6F1]MCP9915388.1 methylthioribulose 1-phosphate dehydratase [Cyanobium sp. ATX 6F1]